MRPRRGAQYQWEIFVIWLRFIVGLCMPGTRHKWDRIILGEYIVAGGRVPETSVHGDHYLVIPICRNCTKLGRRAVTEYRTP